MTEQVKLATLSFTKYLMWKDLVDRTDLLKRNPVVRHLIDTPTHSYEGSGAGFLDARTIDEIIDPAELFAPLSADSSQIAAVVAAQRGADYVLFGPPGTGKSQTIANAITNCLAHQKTVLFVSQKTAALEVVQAAHAGASDSATTVSRCTRPRRRNRACWSNSRPLGATATSSPKSTGRRPPAT